MSAFRKLAFALTAGALAVSTAVAQVPLPNFNGAPAQPDAPGFPGITNALTVAPNVPVTTTLCNTTANPLTVRSEGFSELLGDVILSCSGTLQLNTRNFAPALPGGAIRGSDVRTPVPVVNISVTLSTPVTTDIVGGNSMTDALLFISDQDGNLPLNPTPGAFTTKSTAPAAQRQNPCPTASVNANGNCAFPGSGVSFVAADTATEATSLVSNSSPTAAVLSNATTTPINVFQGQLQNNNTVVFLGVPISQFDSSQNPNITEALLNIVRTTFAGNLALYDGRAIAVPFQKRFVVKNLRGAIPGAAAAGGQVFGFLSIQNPPANLQVNSATPVVGFVQDSLLFRLRNTGGGADTFPRGYVVCQSVNNNFATDAAATSFGTGADLFATGRFDELYANAFKVRGFAAGQANTFDQNNPTITYNSESGFYNQQFPATNGMNQAGIADHGTRLRIAFNNVQANTRLYVSAAGTVASIPAAATNPTLGAYGVVTDATGANVSIITTPVIPTSTASITTALSPGIPTAGLGFPSNIGITGVTPANGWVQVGVPSTGGSASFTWEVYTADPNNPEWIGFAIFISYRSSLNPALGTSTAQGSYAPVNTTATASALAPEPRFADRSTALSLFSISTCITNLLFPFVSNIAPFDTGIAISNTSLSNPGTGELFGAAPATQQGSCSINYFGFTGTGRGAAPAPATSGVIPPGQTLTFTLLSGGGAPFGNIPATPGFQGYIIAQCAFRYAHGYAFISDIGATQLAHGYIALVMDAAIGSRTGAASESLGL